ncbi:Hypothetical proteinA domain [Nesidiocoris tenuis]|uniref:PXA domain-containing protein n=1 Tax=Nesidiocoris tenuis TaxID=355587 RepID=A0ABN7B4L9_9HEMI|nr:Hypothetical proteinA domain [Nesidiocoris tenuis]
MERRHGQRILDLISDTFVQSVSVLLSSAVALTSVFFGWYGGLVALSFFSAGIGVSLLLIRSGEWKAPRWLASIVANSLLKQQPPSEQDAAKCNVCGDQNCDREKVVHVQKPWAGLNVPKEIDAAVESLLERCLEEYVQSWYTKVSLDSSFPTELRQNIRYAASVILNRLLEVDLGTFLSKKVIPTFVQHVNVCLPDERKPDQARRIPYHPALFSRKAELDYLRYRVNEILPQLLEPRNLKCRLYSGLITEILAGWILLPLASTADTSILHNLLLILLGGSSLTPYPPSSSENVEFLSAFAGSHVGLESNHHALHPDLCRILKDQSLLYAFMQFLKDQGAVHILQFCLDVEQFNQRMLVPELSSNEMDILHRDAWDLFSVYFSPHSPDNIGFPSDLVVQMRKVLSKDVTKLRTSPPLFMAFEHAYGLLDKNYCPLFHTSDEFYTWLCGPRTPASHNVSGASSPSIPGSPARLGRSPRRNDGAVSKLSTKLHKIKGALKPQTVDGQIFDTDVLPLEGDTEFGEELDEEEEERDLSSFRIKVKDVEYDLTSSKSPTYLISVRKLGDGYRVEEEWTVERRLVDFYALEGKLTEFHGDFPDMQLPPCGLLAPRLPTNPEVYETYLQKMVMNPSLKGSDLLYRFLTPSSLEFGAEDNAFGRLLRKSVPLTLRKERGQNMEHFIAAFYQSTDTKRPKSEWKEDCCDVQPRRLRCLTNSVFRDNLGINLCNFPQGPPANCPSVLTIKGTSDALLVLGAKVFKVPNCLMRLAVAVHSLLDRGLNSLCCYYLDKKLKSLLVPQRIAHLVGLLQWVVFEKHTRRDPKEVAALLEQRINLYRGWKRKIYQSLYILVRNQIQNKQLFYALLDLVLDELFHKAPSKTQ